MQALPRRLHARNASRVTDMSASELALTNQWPGVAHITLFVTRLFSVFSVESDSKCIAWLLSGISAPGLEKFNLVQDYLEKNK